MVTLWLQPLGPATALLNGLAAACLALFVAGPFLLLHRWGFIPKSWPRRALRGAGVSLWAVATLLLWAWISGSRADSITAADGVLTIHYPFPHPARRIPASRLEGVGRAHYEAEDLALIRARRTESQSLLLLLKGGERIELSADPSLALQAAEDLSRLTGLPVTVEKAPRLFPQ